MHNDGSNPRSTIPHAPVAFICTHVQPVTAFMAALSSLQLEGVFCRGIVVLAGAAAAPRATIPSVCKSQPSSSIFAIVITRSAPIFVPTGTFAH